MWEVWFISWNNEEVYVFMGSIADHATAERIAKNLTDEGFVLDAWATKE